MTLTLFDLTYRTAVELGIVYEGVATGGTVNTLVDTRRAEVDGYWNRGTVWIIRDAAGAGAAPQGEMDRVSAWTLANHTITFASNLTQQVASGDRYALGKRRYDQNVLIQHVNAALQALGAIPVTDTTLTTVANQTEYSLPAAAKPDLRQVWLERNKDTDDHEWQELYGWHTQVGATGAVNTLVLPNQPDSGYGLKLVYVAPHPYLALATDKLSEAVPVERVVYRATELCLNWYRLKTRTNNRAHLDAMEKYTALANQADNIYPILMPSRPGRILVPSNRNVHYPGDQGRV